MPIVLLLIAAIIGTGAVSTSAKPGEALFPVKLTLENVQELVTLDAKAKAGLQAQHALDRLKEVRAQVANGNAAGLNVAIANLEEKVKGAADSVKAAGDPATAKKIEDDLTEVENEVDSLTKSSVTDATDDKILGNVKDLTGIEKARLESIISPGKAKDLLKDALEKAQKEASESAKEVEEAKTGSTEDKQTIEQHHSIIETETKTIENEQKSSTSTTSVPASTTTTGGTSGSTTTTTTAAPTSTTTGGSSTTGSTTTTSGGTDDSGRSGGGSGSSGSGH